MRAAIFDVGGNLRKVLNQVNIGTLEYAGRAGTGNFFVPRQSPDFAYDIAFWQEENIRFQVLWVDPGLGRKQWAGVIVSGRDAGNVLEFGCQYAPWMLNKLGWYPAREGEQTFFPMQGTGGQVLGAYVRSSPTDGYPIRVARAEPGGPVIRDRTSPVSIYTMAQMVSKATGFEWMAEPVVLQRGRATQLDVGITLSRRLGINFGASKAFHGRTSLVSYTKEWSVEEGANHVVGVGMKADRVEKRPVASVQSRWSGRGRVMEFVQHSDLAAAGPNRQATRREAAQRLVIPRTYGLTVTDRNLGEEVTAMIGIGNVVTIDILRRPQVRIIGYSIDFQNRGRILLVVREPGYQDLEEIESV